MARKKVRKALARKAGSPAKRKTSAKKAPARKAAKPAARRSQAKAVVLAPLVVRIPKALMDQLDREADQKGVARSVTVRDIFEAHFFRATQTPTTPAKPVLVPSAPGRVSVPSTLPTPESDTAPAPAVGDVTVEVPDEATPFDTPDRALDVEKALIEAAQRVEEPVTASRACLDPEKMNGAADVLGGPGDPDATLGDLQSPSVASMRDNEG